MDMNYVKFFNKYLFFFFHRPFIVFQSMNTFENHLECIWLNKSISHFSSTKKRYRKDISFSIHLIHKPILDVHNPQ